MEYDVVIGDDSVMTVTSGTIAHWQLVRLAGKFTVKNIALVKHHFEASEKAVLPKVVIDMSKVSQLDSSAITILINFQRRIIQKGGMLVLLAMAADIFEIFSIVGIDKTFRICTTFDEFRTTYLEYSM